MANNKTKITAESGKQELFIEREFDAPREFVFKAHTDPELYAEWLGPRGYEIKIDKFEPRRNLIVWLTASTASSDQIASSASTMALNAITR